MASILPQVTGVAGSEPPPPPVLTIGSTTLTANAATQYFVGPGKTLTPGGAVTVSGTTLSGPAALTTPPPLTIGNGVYTAIPGTGTTYLIGGSVLTPGGIITVAGTTISLAPGATAVIVNGITSELLPTATITNAPLLTIGMATYTALSGTGTTFVIGGQTLTPGGIITVSGTTISLSPSATALVFDSGSGTTTETLFPATTIPTTVKTTDTVAGSASAGATPTGATKPSHGAAADARPSADIISILMLAFGISLGSI
ncbi:hypothetical protein K432DRAFT_290874 [Lepidopterella palustris CBS 459.81]|uniref:Uncharacterized protein n=1 Tax=Lepidopterella palustris CBS 459.81 TaxID=1314670 RepID=A0A8E2EGQ6_9PEZI|nr:hypothetical protein K432DRAFT_290874 [Lepidopterella palustris CBS 459.81]